jgi:hypothetical protein
MLDKSWKLWMIEKSWLSTLKPILQSFGDPQIRLPLLHKETWR